MSSIVQVMLSLSGVPSTAICYDAHHQQTAKLHLAEQPFELRAVELGTERSRSGSHFSDADLDNW